MKKIICCLCFFYLICLTACQKGNEPFSKKLAVDFSYITANGDTVNHGKASSFSVASGNYITAFINIGGEERFGDNTVVQVVEKFEITTVNSRGTSTCILIPRAMLAYGRNWRFPIRENMTLTFTITSESGETATQGPFTITAVNNQLVFSDTASCFGNSFFALSTGNPTAPYSYYSQYNYDNNAALEVKYPLLGGDTIGTDKFLVIPSKFSYFGIAPNIVSQYTCGWNATKIMPYTGSMDLNENPSLNTYNYADLNALSVSTSQDSLLVSPGAKFVFETPEGKKGLGKFLMVQPSDNIGFVFQCQR